MAKTLVPKNQNIKLAELFLNDVHTSNSYYLYTGRYYPATNTELIDSVTDSFDEAYNNMLQAKIISDANVVIRNIPYATGTVYDVYEDDVDLDTKDYYAIVNASSYYHIFKCLDNNHGASSTVTPLISDITGANTQSYQTSDGYVWKYMYTVTNTLANKFKSSDYFPLVPNTDVSDTAVAGSIDSIRVIDGGRRYDNYVVGTFKTTDIKINGNSQLYAVSNSIAATVNGFYTGCMLYISSGSALGEHRTIVDYISNSNGNFIVLDSQLSGPTNGTGYQIYPTVEIVGSGTETINAVARALVNSVASNSVYKVEIIERGANYTHYTANVIANSVVDFVSATLKPIISPPGGHGSNAAKELQASTVALYVPLQNTESNTIIADSKYSQIGIIKNPAFSNVEITFDESSLTFVPYEGILNVVKTSIGKATTNADSLDITLETPNPDLVSNNILIWDGNTYYQYCSSFTLANSTTITLPANNELQFTSNDATVYLLDVIGSGNVITQTATNTILVDNYTGKLAVNNILIGTSSFSVGTVNAISRNDQVKGFNTFIQMYKYKATLSSGTFEQGETLLQGNSSAILYSMTSDGANLTFYTTQQMGSFNNITYVLGSNSSAQCLINKTYLPEIIHGSGDILYMENISTVTREPNETETYVLYFDF